MNYNGLAFWFQVIQFVITAFIGVYVYVANRYRVTIHRVKLFEDETDKRFEKHSERITRTEERLKRMPQHDDMNDLHARITELQGEVREAAGKLDGISASVNLINQHLLNSGK
jgi:hypothetical protein